MAEDRRLGCAGGVGSVWRGRPALQLAAGFWRLAKRLGSAHGLRRAWRALSRVRRRRLVCVCASRCASGPSVLALRVDALRVDAVRVDGALQGSPVAKPSHASSASLALPRPGRERPSRAPLGARPIGSAASQRACAPAFLEPPRRAGGVIIVDCNPLLHVLAAPRSAAYAADAANSDLARHAYRNKAAEATEGWREGGRREGGQQGEQATGHAAGRTSCQARARDALEALAVSLPRGGKETQRSVSLPRRAPPGTTSRCSHKAARGRGGR